MDLQGGIKIHVELARSGVLRDGTHIGGTIAFMYTKCGALGKASEVFNIISLRNIVQWNVLISGYVKHDQAERALTCLEQLQHEGLLPDAVSFVLSLKACGSIGASSKGQEIHAAVFCDEKLRKDTVVCTSLIGMYAKCGLLEEAHEAFDELLVPNVVAWNALITGYAHHGHSKQALNCCDWMRREGVSPNVVTFLLMLKACGSMGDVYKGQETHAEIARMGMLAKDRVVGNALVGMYARCGVLAKAQEAFNELPTRDVFSWGAIISAYAQHSGGEEGALYYFQQMQHDGVPQNRVISVCMLEALGKLGALGNGQELHEKILEEGILEFDIGVATALVQMYAKCGAVSIAQAVFWEFPIHNVVLWSALMAGYADIGNDKAVFELFDKMVGEGQEPDPVTFITLLNMCSNTGLLDEGRVLFARMSSGYGLVPTLEHHVCMVDLYGRVGLLGKAAFLIKGMPFLSSLSSWHTLLGACQKWGDVVSASWAFEHVLGSGEHKAAGYVRMSNILVANFSE